MAPVLPIPGTLNGQNFTAAAGTYIMPAAKSNIQGTCTVDLSAANFIDGGGNIGLFNVKDGAHLTVLGGQQTTSTMTGTLCFINDNAVCTVVFDGWQSTGCPKLVGGNRTSSGAAAPQTLVTARNVVASGLAIGIEGFWSIDVDACSLTGGGPATNPVGLHIFQDAAKLLLWIPGLHLRCTNSTVTGYISSATQGFRQGDSILVESTTESFFIDNCTLGSNSDSGGLDSKACYGQISNNTIHSPAGRAISGHVMGDGRGPWNGVRSIGNTIDVPNSVIPLSGGFTEVYQAEGVLEAFDDVITMVAGSRLAVTSFDDAPGSGAQGSYPRLGNIAVHNAHTPGGVLITGPVVHGDDATHHTTITVDAATSNDRTVTPAQVVATADIVTPTITGINDATVSPAAVVATTGVAAVTVLTGAAATVTPASVDAVADVRSVAAFQVGVHNPDTVESTVLYSMAMA